MRVLKCARAYVDVCTEYGDQLQTKSILHADSVSFVACVLPSCQQKDSGLIVGLTMRATCQACGVRHACGPAHTAVNAQAAVNAQCFRRSLRLPCTQNHAAKGHRAGLRCIHPAVRQQGRATPGSVATQYKTTASTELVRVMNHICVHK